jgi:hypothetical protein
MPILNKFIDMNSIYICAICAENEKKPTDYAWLGIFCLKLRITLVTLLARC